MNNPIAVSPNRQPVSRQVSKAGTGAAQLSKWIVAIVMGFFSGILLYMLLR